MRNRNTKRCKKVCQPCDF